MSEFNRMTIVAAAEVVAHANSHGDMRLLEVQWEIDEKCAIDSKSARAASWATLALNNEPTVITENGRMSLGRAIVETAIAVPRARRNEGLWKKLVAGLRFDGFEIVEAEDLRAAALQKMLPNDIPGLDFRDAENEVFTLLDRYELVISRGHLRQAISAFQRSEWSSANGELRNFFESYLSEIACSLGYNGNGDAKTQRDFLGKGIQPPFLLDKYNEWNENNQKPQYIQGLMSRMHPHGGHPGLSEEEDATFRLQITLVTARLLLRRLSQR